MTSSFFSLSQIFALAGRMQKRGRAEVVVSVSSAFPNWRLRSSLFGRTWLCGREIKSLGLVNMGGVGVSSFLLSGSWVLIRVMWKWWEASGCYIGLMILYLLTKFIVYICIEDSESYYLNQYRSSFENRKILFLTIYITWWGKIFIFFVARKRQKTNYLNCYIFYLPKLYYVFSIVLTNLFIKFLIIQLTFKITKVFYKIFYKDFIVELEVNHKTIPLANIKNMMFYTYIFSFFHYTQREIL